MSSKLKKRLIVTGVVLLVGLSSIGVYQLSKGVVDRGYSSSEIVYSKEFKDEKEENKAPITEGTNETIITGAREEVDDGSYDDTSKYYPIQKVLDSKGSPYERDWDKYVASEYSIEGSSDYVVAMSLDGEEVLSVYCNSIDNYPYMYVKDSEFSEEELSFFMSFGNCSSGINEDGCHYVLYI